MLRVILSFILVAIYVLSFAANTFIPQVVGQVALLLMGAVVGYDVAHERACRVAEPKQNGPIFKDDYRLKK